jgi:hypothetical protein
MAYGRPKSSSLLQHARWRPFSPTELAAEDMPRRLVWIVRVGRTDYYVGLHYAERNIYRFTKYRAGKLVNEWEIADIGDA